MSAEAKGCTLEFNNLCYSVLVTDPDTETTVTKPLLSNITGVAKNREVTAIVGHSGAGKTTLLDCLAGRVEESSIRGEISLNGMPVRQASFRRMSGYVLQTDNLFPMLTARESLLYGAALMLSPDQYNEEQRETRVDGLLKQLDLETVRDEIVGDGVVVPGISSGSRRRVSVAMELVRNPPVVVSTLSLFVKSVCVSVYLCGFVFLWVRNGTKNACM